MCDTGAIIITMYGKLRLTHFFFNVLRNSEGLEGLKAGQKGFLTRLGEASLETLPGKCGRMPGGV
jgi:hypothetical protein